MLIEITSDFGSLSGSADISGSGSADDETSGVGSEETSGSGSAVAISGSGSALLSLDLIQTKSASSRLNSQPLSQLFSK